jgi:hypothetical protein
MEIFLFMIPFGYRYFKRNNGFYISQVYVPCNDLNIRAKKHMNLYGIEPSFECGIIILFNLVMATGKQS